MHAFLSSLQPVLRPVDAILTGQGVTFVVQEEREIGVTLNCYYDFVVQEERAEPLWKALERVIPDIRKRAEVTLIGSPLTHEFWLRRNKGTYGAAISAQKGSFPGPQTPIKNLYR